MVNFYNETIKIQFNYEPLVLIYKAYYKLE